ncbi:MAG: hypothetical protein HKO65_08830 [Gemmatimonadetes bacterium]|nr:hypothetical protein [Gemmatimonadota bacterium]NNM05192.1 hypothetical protein [Gemmatimonadota bacterium]
MTIRSKAPFLFFILLSLACYPTSGEGSSGDTPMDPGVQTPESLEGDYLYHVVMLRAAPGRLLDLIELLKEERDLLGDANEPIPYWMRHTQGDQWDLLILYPMGSFHEYFEPGRTARRLESGTQKGLSERDLKREVDRLTSWRDELFVRGPDPSVVDEGFSQNDFYHIEMFVALAGRQRDLLEERRMENRYLQGIGRPQNLIFVREAGGPWDSFTLGFYRDLKHYSESADIPAEAEDRAAKEAGFEGADKIGSFLRRFILYHRDTLCVSIS